MPCDLPETLIAIGQRSALGEQLSGKGTGRDALTGVARELADRRISSQAIHLPAIRPKTRPRPIPPFRRWGSLLVRSTCEKSSTACFIFSTRAANGEPCRKTCHRRASCSAISTCGTGTTRSAVSFRNSMRNAVGRWVARPARRPQSSTAKASKA